MMRTCTLIGTALLVAAAAAQSDEHDHAHCPEEDICERAIDREDHDDEEHDHDHGHLDNEQLAIALTCAAGLTMALGASLVWCLPRRGSGGQGGPLARWRRVMAMGYASASGVMVYLAFADLLPESQNYLCCVDDGHYKAAAAGSLFAGVLLTLGIEAAIATFLGHHSHLGEDEAATSVGKFAHHGGAAVDANTSSESDPLVPAPEPTSSVGVSSAELSKISFTTIIGMALHNLPEGIALYIGTLANEDVGITLFIAIALHNIPGGAAVAVPIFAATDSRLKGFLWGSAVGMVQPLAALITWGLLEKRISPAFFGIAMGATAGILAVVSLGGLLPLALKLEPSRAWTMTAFFSGCAVMAIVTGVMEALGGHGH